MRVPKRFTIGCHQWRVQFVSDAAMRKRAGDKDDYETTSGMTLFSENKIIILRGMQPSLEWHTFWHEYMHVLTSAAGLTRLSEDEGKIDILGMLTAQAIQTMRF